MIIKKRWTKYEVEKLKELYPKTSWEVILKEFPNRTKRSICGKMLLFKIKRQIIERDYKEHGNLLRKGNLFSLLKNTNKIYYWIGFILADGYICNPKGILSISLSIKDLKHIKKLAKIINSNISIKTLKNKKQYVTIGVQHPEIVKQLIQKFDFKPRKTYNPPSPEILDRMTDEQFLSFLCGYIDGDGCIIKRKDSIGAILQISCHSSYLNFLKKVEIKLYKILKFKFKKSYIKINKRGYTNFSISNIILLRELKQKIIKLNIPYLERKWNNITKLT